MYSGVEQAIRKVIVSIPKQILDVAFEPAEKHSTIDERIRHEVIEFRVMPDCNLYSGQYKLIPLANCIYKETPMQPGMVNVTDTYGGVYVIPEEERDFKNIASVINVDYPLAINRYGLGPFVSAGGQATLVGAARATLNSHAPASSFTPPTPIYLGNNTVRMHPGTYLQTDWILTCRLEYDNEMRNMENASIATFADLVVTAVKAYIYNALIVRIDAAYLAGGVELGAIKDIILSYADANEQYEEKLLKFRGSEYLNTDTRQQLLRFVM